MPAFDCDAAFDANNDGGRNIVDVVALVQGMFGTDGYVIPPPAPPTPGVGSTRWGGPCRPSWAAPRERCVRRDPLREEPPP